MKPLSFLLPQTVHRTSSTFSGEIKVIDHVFERRLVVGGLTQSGGILGSMWKKALEEKRIKDKQSLRSDELKGLMIKNVLVLGLGAGTVAEVINKKWPDAKIVGVEIDPIIIETGKKYFSLNNISNLKIVIDDAVQYIYNEPTTHNSKLFDIIIVDLYKGYTIEKNVQNEAFLQKLSRILSKNGIIIFNVLSAQNGNFEAKIFLDKLSRIYKDYFCKRIISNDFFFAQNSITKGGDSVHGPKKEKEEKIKLVLN